MPKSSTITKAGETHYSPITPGEILKEEFIAPFGLTLHSLAQKIGVPQTRIQAIVKDGREITADTALRLARFR
jgi:addiction module HigA family antidote